MKKKNIISRLSLLLSVFMCVGSYGVRADEKEQVTPNIELTASANNEDNSISLSWKINDTKNKYSYMIYSKDSKEPVFQSIPAKSTVKVLNVYPSVGNNLKKWMETDGYGKGVISVDEVDIKKYNNNANSYLKNTDGTWKYDVIYFGAWDSNNGIDLSSSAAADTSKFLDDGRGVLFGHDTVGDYHPGFWRLRNYLNIERSEYTGGKAEVGEGKKVRVQVERNGLLTNYPYKLEGELIIPSCHSTHQGAKGDIWMRFKEHSYENIVKDYYDNANFYLTTWNNAAMIQTGHNNGQATPDEEKILANTLFYLSQVTEETSWTDHKGQDLVAPSKPTNLQASRDLEGNIDISFDKSIDLGNTYEYYVEATEKATGNKVRSDTKSVTLTSGIKGYSISVDTNPKGVPSGKITTTNNKYTINQNINGPFYVHVAAVDNAGNVSEVTSYKCDYPKLDLTASTTDKTHNAVTITAKGTSTESSIKEIKLPSGEIVEGSTAEYKVEENGTYTFEVTDIEGRKTRESIVVNNILMPLVLNVELPKSEVKVNDEVEVYLSIDHITNIKSEQATIKYDAAKLQFLGMEKAEGQRFIRSSKTSGEIKVILSSADKKQLITGHKVLLKMKFKAKDLGKTLIYVKDGKISNGLNMERDLFKDECGEEFLTVK